MIRSDEEVQVALDWIAYWRSTRVVGQSWLGNEQAARTISQLRQEIDEYRRGVEAAAPDLGDQLSRQPV